jgi:tetratricopeptide (TPR) repeat protein
MAEQDHSVSILQTEVREMQVHLNELYRRVLAVDEAEKEITQAIENQKTRPWYRDIATYISMAALMLSFASTMLSFTTTVVSEYRLRQERVRNDRAELRSYLQRIIALPKESLELRSRFSELEAGQLTGYLTAENELLVRQAVELITLLPEAKVSATEILLVTHALLTSGDYESARQFLVLAEPKARISFERLAIARGWALLEFAQGNAEQGRAWYQRGLQLIDQYPSQNTGQDNWLRAEMYMYWASSEMVLGLCEEAQAYMQEALKYLDILPAGQGKASAFNQYNELKATMDGCES